MTLRIASPELSTLKDALNHSSTNRYIELLTSPNLDDSRYLHWEELQYRTPPEGFSIQEWWLKLKSQRRAQARFIELHDKFGAPFHFSMTDELLRLVEQVSRRSGSAVVDGGSAITPRGRNSYIVRSLIEEAITSSQLEGASTTRRVAVEMIDSGRAPTDKSERMILNNYQAMSFIKSRAAEPFSPAFALELHSILTRDTLDDPDDAGRLEPPGVERVSVWAGEKRVHVPPPAEESPGRLELLCNFANGTSQSTPYIPPVVRAIITHFMFGYDHYFTDGNGRTARAAFYWGMLHNGYWLAEYLSISKILKDAPGQYGDSYEHSEDDDGDLTYFILHQLRVIIRALDELDAFIETRRAETRKVQEALHSFAGDFNARQTQLIEWLSREGFSAVTAIEVANRYGVTTQTARNDLSHLEQAGLLRRGPGARPIKWLPAPDLPATLTALHTAPAKQK